MDHSTVISGGLVGAIGTVCTILLGTVGVAFKSVSGVTQDLRTQLDERNEQFVEMSRTISELQYEKGQLSARVGHLEERCGEFSELVTSLRRQVEDLTAEVRRLSLPPGSADETLRRR